MPLYEGIALIQEKQAVVLDLGDEYTKFGFTGEAAPRCIVRSEFWCPRERCMRRVHNYSTREELYYNLVHMLHALYYRHVLVNPKERRVVVLESLLTPALFRETLAAVLYTHYEVSGVVWADTGRACCAALGVGSLLTVSVGARETELCAVLHVAPLTHATQTHEGGARAVRAELARLLDRDNDATLQLPEHILEDIAVKTCFVAPRERAIQWQQFEDGAGPEPTAARSVRYSVAGRSALTVSGRTRELIAEPLFYRDNDRASLPDLVLQCIMQCPRDARRPLAENILVTGGLAALPGFKSRLAQELRYLLTQPPYDTRLHVKELKFHTAPAHDNYTAWLGAGVAGAAYGTRALSREQYVRERRLRDWPDSRDNTPPNHPHWQGL